MKSKLLDKKDNKLMKREEARIELEHPGVKTPDKKTVTEEAAKILNVNEKLLIIKKIETKFGSSKSAAIVHVYKNREDLEANEPKFLIKRNTFEEAKPAEKKEGE